MGKGTLVHISVTARGIVTFKGEADSPRALISLLFFA